MTDEDSESLIRVFGEEEVKAAVWETKSDSAPGPNGSGFISSKPFGTRLKRAF